MTRRLLTIKITGKSTLAYALLRDYFSRPFYKDLGVKEDDIYLIDDNEISGMTPVGIKRVKKIARILIVVKEK